MLMPPTLRGRPSAGPACARAISGPGPSVTAGSPESVDAQNLVHLKGQTPLRVGQAIFGGLAGVALFNGIGALLRYRRGRHGGEEIMPGLNAQKALRRCQRLWIHQF